VRETTADQLMAVAASHMRATHTLLDIGPGIRPQTLIGCKVHLMAEPCDEYRDILAAKHPRYVPFSADWDAATKLLTGGVVDTVVLLDVIEHLERDEGRRLLDKTIELARSQVVIFTPLGFMPQESDTDKDAWGLSGVDWQVHRSGWTPDDFDGWKIVVCPDFHHFDAYGRELETPHGAFFAILDKGAGVSPGVGVRVRHALRVANRRIWATRLGVRIRGRLVRAHGIDPLP